jgi:hypothetical protein
MSAETETPEARRPSQPPRPLHTRKSAWKLGWPRPVVQPRPVAPLAPAVP